MKKNKLNLQSPVAAIIIAFLTIVLPLVYFRNILDPVLMPRLLFLSTFLAGVYLYFFWIKSPVYLDLSMTAKPVFIFLFGYFLITAISGIWAINFREGIFDMVKTFSIFALTAILVLVFNQTIHWPVVLLKSVVVAAFLASFIGFYEYFKQVVFAENPFLPDGRPVIYSVTGLMAHRNQFSISLMLMLPFVGYGLFTLTRQWKWAAALSGLFLFILMLLLQTRSVWLALIFSGIVTIVVSSIFYKNLAIRKRTVIIGLTVMLGAVMAGSVLIRYFAKQYPDTQIGEISGLLDLYSAKNYNRFRIYNVTMEMIADQPLWGVGAGNWKIQSPAYYNAYHFNREQLNWIRPHNDWLWVWSEKGIFGLLFFLGIFVFTFLSLFKILLSNIEHQKKVFALFLIGGLTGYIVVSLFSFPLERINQQVYLSLIIASASAIHYQILPTKPFMVNKKLILSVMLPFLLFGIYYSSVVVNMEYRVNAARTEQMRRNWPGLASAAAKIPQTLKNIDADATPVQWYAGLAATNTRNFANAVLAYEKARSFFPTHVKVLNNLAQAYIETGNYEKGMEMCEKALSVLRYYPEAFANYAFACMKTGRYEKSLEMFLKIREHDRSTFILQLMSELMMNKSFITKQHFDIWEKSFCGNTVSKYQKLISSDYTWHNDVVRKAKIKNVSLEKAVFDEVCFVAKANEPENFLSWYGVEYLESIIKSDSAWISAIQAKSNKNNLSFESQLTKDAFYLFEKENPAVCRKYLLIKEWKQKILANDPLKTFIAEKAKVNNQNFDEMMDVYAGYIASIQIRTTDVEEERINAIIKTIRMNPDWYQKIVRKAKQEKKSVEETLWNEGYWISVKDK